MTEWFRTGRLDGVLIAADDDHEWHLATKADFDAFHRGLAEVASWVARVEANQRRAVELRDRRTEERKRDQAKLRAQRQRDADEAAEAAAARRQERWDQWTNAAQRWVGDLRRQWTEAQGTAPDHVRKTSSAPPARRRQTEEDPASWDGVLDLLEQLTTGTHPLFVVGDFNDLHVARVLLTWTVMCNELAAEHGPEFELEYYEEATDRGAEVVDRTCVSMPGWSEEVSRHVAMVWAAAGTSQSELLGQFSAWLADAEAGGSGRTAEAFLAGCMALLTGATGHTFRGVRIPDRLRRVLRRQIGLATP